MYAAHRTRTSNVNHSQREAFNTKSHSLTMGVINKGTGNKGLDTVYQELEYAAVTVNLITSEVGDNHTKMELIGEDIEGEEREVNKEENKGEEETDSYAEMLSFLTEPSTESTEAPILLPNILIPCTKCGAIVNICRLSSHRTYHTALQTLKYAHDQRPKNLNALVRRRRLLIKQQQEASSVNESHTFVDKYLHKVNAAFEVLRIELQGNTDSRRLNDRNFELSLKGRGFDLNCTTAAGVCEEANARWKHMEDIHTYKEDFLDNVTSCFLAIYDGYSGRNTASKCSQYLHEILKEELDAIFENGQTRPPKRNINAAFRSTFLKTERTLLLSEDEPSQGRWSGCSAVTCVLTSDTCFIANAGNVGAILLRSNDVAKVLTHKHDLYNKSERDRVKKSRGTVVKTEKCALINGALGVTRGIGSIGDMALKRCVINEPNVKCVPLKPSDQVIILASGGFWKIFSYEETVYLVNGFFDQIKERTKQEITGGKINALTRNKISENQKFIRGHSDDPLFRVMVGKMQTSKSSHRFEKGKQFLKKMENNVIKRSKSDENLARLVTFRQDKEGSEVFGNDELDYVKYTDSWDSGLKVCNDDEQESCDVNFDFLRRHRLSLPDETTLRFLKDASENELSRPEKAKLLAQCLAERLVKCALYAESMDNITVFVVLLPGFSLINWQMVTPHILEKLNEFIDADET